jgi:hypothetical protein
MRRVILLVCLLGCGGGGTGSTMMATGGSPGTGGAAGQVGNLGGSSGTADTGAGGADPGTGGSIGGSGGAFPDGSATGGLSGNAGTGGASTGGSAGGIGDAGGGGDPLYCPQTPGLAYNGCGFLKPSGDWTSTWKGGYACATCAASGSARSGCLMQSVPGTKVEGPGPVLCVASCSECCFRAVGSTCSSDAECCAPLRCQTGDAGMKTCR